MSLAFDETGRPFIILREQGKKKRVKGAEAHKVSLKACIYQIKQFNYLNAQFLKILYTIECLKTRRRLLSALFKDELLYTSLKGSFINSMTK